MNDGYKCKEDWDVDMKDWKYQWKVIFIYENDEIDVDISDSSESYIDIDEFE